MRNGLRDDRRAEQVGRTDTDLEDAKARVANKLRLRPRVLTASALTGRNVTRLLVEAVALADRARARIETAELNRFVAEIQSQRQPPAVRGRRLRHLLRDAGRGGPPRFRVFVNDRRLIVRDYAYFFENRLRERYRLEGVPLVIDFVDRERRERRPGGSPARRARRAMTPRSRALRSRLTFDRLALAVVLIGGVLVVASRWSQGSDRRRGARSRRLPRARGTRCSMCTSTSNPTASQWSRADEIVRQLPALRRLRDQALDNLSRGRRPLDFETQVRPWIGDEAALALLRER